MDAHLSKYPIYSSNWVATVQEKVFLSIKFLIDHNVMGAIWTLKEGVGRETILLQIVLELPSPYQNQRVFFQTENYKKSIVINDG